VQSGIASLKRPRRSAQGRRGVERQRLAQRLCAGRRGRERETVWLLNGASRND